ncbi:MAG: ABC transporter ATP-binding protein, partial [Candidatus Puniceispirillaceae bacterium]
MTASHDTYDGPILEIDNLSISFFTRLREIPAVMDFSCEVKPGEAMGLVGESGCGKSTVALGVMQDLGVNGRIVGGSIKFKGQDLSEMSEAELRQIRGSEIAMIYQEPMASLNPAMRIGKQLAEVPMIHKNMSRDEAMALARQVVEDVRLPDPDRILQAYPHQLSGGQQQRIVIAMALMSQPSLLILDEPTTGLHIADIDRLLQVLHRLRDAGNSLVVIEHNLDV